jgi:hypothetical protein
MNLKLLKFIILIGAPYIKRDKIKIDKLNLIFKVTVSTNEIVPKE